MLTYLIKLLTMLRNIFIIIILKSFIFNQINDVNISVEYRNAKGKTIQYLDEFKKDIEFYMLSTIFLESPNESINLVLDVNFIIESISNDIISTHVLFSNRSDQILFSDGVEFEYEIGQNLFYTTTYNSLTSFLNYNIFMMLAGELDKFNYKGGDNYYIRSEDIAFQATLSEYPRRWDKRLKQSKELKENIYLRNMKYLYQTINNQLQETDDEYDEEIIINHLNDLHYNLMNIDDEYGYHKNTMQFLNANRIKIVELYYDYEMENAIKFLSNYDEDNINFYKDYID